VAGDVGLVIHTLAPLSVVLTQVALIGANIRPILRDIFAVCLNVLAIRLDVFVIRLDILLVRPNIRPVSRDISTVRLDVALVAVGGSRSLLRIGLARSSCGLLVGGVRCWQRSAED
jgi:hypothetical protein